MGSIPIGGSIFSHPWYLIVIPAVSSGLCIGASARTLVAEHRHDLPGRKASARLEDADNAFFDLFPAASFGIPALMVD